MNDIQQSNKKFTLQIDIDMEALLDKAYSAGAYEGYVPSFEDFLVSEIRRASIGHITKEQREAIGQEVATVFKDQLAATISEAVNAKLESFLGEDVAVSDKWGTSTFVGSIDDLLKKEFDDRLLHPVDGQGRRLQGCTSSSTTYVQWLVSHKIDEALKRQIDNARDAVSRATEKMLKEEMDKIKTDAAAKAIAALNISLK